MSARSAAAPAAHTDAARLADALSRVNRSLRREVQLPLGASTLQALAALHDQDRMRLGDLARHEGVAPATLSRIVALLEEEGLARRTADDADRRSSFLEITPQGSRIVADVRAARGRALAARLERLDEAHRSRLLAALDALELLAEPPPQS